MSIRHHPSSGNGTKARACHLHFNMPDAEVSRLGGIFANHRSARPPSGGVTMIRKLKSGKYRIYSRNVSPSTGKRRNLGTFDTREAAEKHEREIQYFKRH